MGLVGAGYSLRGYSLRVARSSVGIWGPSADDFSQNVCWANAENMLSIACPWMCGRWGVRPHRWLGEWSHSCSGEAARSALGKLRLQLASVCMGTVPLCNPQCWALHCDRVRHQELRCSFAAIRSLEECQLHQALAAFDTTRLAALVFYPCFLRVGDREQLMLCIAIVVGHFYRLATLCMQSGSGHSRKSRITVHTVPCSYTVPIHGHRPNS